MSSLILKRLTTKDESAFVEAFNAFSDAKLAFASDYITGMNFEEYVQKLADLEAGLNLKPGYVAGTILYGFIEDKIVGRLSIRHTLNDFLFNYGGHIGYGIVNKYRNRGFAKEMLKQSLVISKNELQLNRVLVTCDNDNIGSIKVIEACGGILENTLLDESSKTLKRRYWIEIL